MYSDVASSPLSRAEWMAARAALAGRRIGRFALGAVVTFSAVLLVLLLIPKLGVSVKQEMPEPKETREDTVQLLRVTTDAERATARAESVYDRALVGAAQIDDERGRASPALRAHRDSLRVLSAQLDSLLDRSARSPLPASFFALADARSLRGELRAMTLRDSLATLERRRSALEPTSGSERSFADLTMRIKEVGLAIRDAAEYRRAALLREIEEGELSLTAAVTDTAGAREARDSARAVTEATAAALAAARVRNAGQDRRQAIARDRARRRVPPVAMLVAATVLAVILGFSVSLLMEVLRPTVANTREAEAVAHCPAFSVAHDEAHGTNGGGMDPFRMLYLGLTVGGARTATVEVRGEDRAVAATVAARLALAAAGDARATLVVDADTEGSAVAGYYRQRPEPGFTDAVAGVRLWREVTRAVGVSDGLAIDVVASGSVRREGLDAATLAAARVEFARFRAEYDFFVAVAPSEVAVLRLSGLLERTTVLLCAAVGSTTIAKLKTAATKVRDAGAILHGVVLWDGALPQVTQRNKLMANALVDSRPSARPTNGMTPL
jgi:hypothetical protein